MNAFKNLFQNRATFKTFNKVQKYMYRPKKYYKPGVEVQKFSNEFQETRRIHTFYNFGLYAAVFGAAFAAVPLFRIFCEHTGITGDYVQKDYSVKQSEVSNKHRKFRVRFKAEADPEVNWEFEPVQDELFVGAGETALMFYRAYNGEPDPVIGFATYNVYPEEAQAYFSKIQCFCFNQQLLNPKEELQLPLYFYLEPEILDDKILDDTAEIRIIYSFIKCAKQDMLRYVEEELERVKKNKEFLQELRDKRALRSDGKSDKSKGQKSDQIELIELKKMEIENLIKEEEQKQLSSSDQVRAN